MIEPIPHAPAEKTELSDAKRALLNRYLHGDRASGLTTATEVLAAASPNMRARVPIVAVQSDGAARPFFYLHVHWQGGAFYCFSLAKDLGPAQPFYVLDPYRFEDVPVTPTIETMAADYIEAMRCIQPEGPYRIGAFCGSSLIAYEMAQQLRAQGQVVERMVFVDPMAGAMRSIRLTGVLIRRLGHLLRIDPDRQLDWFVRLRYLTRVIRRAHDEYTDHADRLIRRWHELHPKHVKFFPAAEALRQDWLAVFIWAASGYRPHPYLGSITYLLARENHDARNLWWGRVKASASVEVRAIEGTHETCRTEHVHGLADHLRACLNASPTT